MPNQRRGSNSVPAASTITLSGALFGWGVLGALSLPATEDALSPTAHGFIRTALLAVTLGAYATHLRARDVRRADETAELAGYAAGYADGSAARDARDAARSNVTQMPPRGSIRS